MPHGEPRDSPTESDLQSLLGGSFPAYRAFLERSDELRPAWKFYGAKAGWSLKLFDKTRNLCFVTPREGEFTIAFLLGPKAVELALEADLPDAIKQEIREARTYVEGRPVRLTVRSTGDLAPALELLAVKRQR